MPPKNQSQKAMQSVRVRRRPPSGGSSGARSCEGRMLASEGGDGYGGSAPPSSAAPWSAGFVWRAVAGASAIAAAAALRRRRRCERAGMREEWQNLLVGGRLPLSRSALPPPPLPCLSWSLSSTPISSLSLLSPSLPLSPSPSPSLPPLSPCVHEVLCYPHSLFLSQTVNLSLLHSLFFSRSSLSLFFPIFAPSPPLFS